MRIKTLDSGGSDQVPQQLRTMQPVDNDIDKSLELGQGEDLNWLIGARLKANLGLGLGFRRILQLECERWKCPDPGENTRGC